MQNFQIEWNHFRVETIAKTPNPQQVIWMAMHQDYSSDYVVEQSPPNEEKCGEFIIKHLLSGGRGHFGPFEHPQITLAAGYFPHSTMQQLRTHRTGITFDVQSGRYTSLQILRAAKGELDIEKVFYLRPVGYYSDRQGAKYFYSPEMRSADLERVKDAANYYALCIDRGMSEEHARGMIPFDIRQHFVVSMNVRSFMHILDMRWKKDAQLECQQFCELAYEQFDKWIPAITQWYAENRAKKARLAP